MDFTGERPSLDQEVEGSRLRYKSIIPFVLNKKVIDYGCGIGLGSHMMSFFAEKVLGFDFCKKAVEEASRVFKSPNLTFVDILHTEYFCKYDIVAMVEVLEHLEKVDLESFLRIYSQCIPEIACTTPDGITMPYQPKTMQERRGYHVWHYTLKELEDLFKKYYIFVEIYGHLYDHRIDQNTSYVIYASNKVKWEDAWIKNAKYKL